MPRETMTTPKGEVLIVLTGKEADDAVETIKKRCSMLYDNIRVKISDEGVERIIGIDYTEDGVEVRREEGTDGPQRSGKRKTETD